MSEERVNRIYKVTDKEYKSYNKGAIFGFFKEHHFLSNYHLCPINIAGMVFTSSEAAYQAMKTEDTNDRIKFTTFSPSEAKEAGRKVTLIEDWDYKKDIIMKDILVAKFRQNPDIRQLLINTKGYYLEETNWWHDTYWGVCDGIGENQLGRILMWVRENY